MSASPAATAVPPNALRMWTDGIRIYVELPGLAGPYIVAYSYCEGGLSKALNLLGANRVDYDYQGAIPSGYKKATRPANTLDTDLRRASVEASLRRMGVLR